MENKRFSDLIQDLQFTANKLTDCIEYADFESIEKRKLREAVDILTAKSNEYNDFKNEEEYWS